MSSSINRTTSSNGKRTDQSQSQTLTPPLRANKLPMSQPSQLLSSSVSSASLIRGGDTAEKLSKHVALRQRMKQGKAKRMMVDYVDRESDDDDDDNDDHINDKEQNIHHQPATESPISDENGSPYIVPPDEWSHEETEIERKRAQAIVTEVMQQLEVWQTTTTMGCLSPVPESMPVSDTSPDLEGGGTETTTTPYSTLLLKQDFISPPQTMISPTKTDELSLSGTQNKSYWAMMEQYCADYKEHQHDDLNKENTNNDNNISKIDDNATLLGDSLISTPDSKWKGESFQITPIKNVPPRCEKEISDDPAHADDLPSKDLPLAISPDCDSHLSRSLTGFRTFRQNATNIALAESEQYLKRIHQLEQELEAMRREKLQKGENPPPSSIRKGSQDSNDTVAANTLAVLSNPSPGYNSDTLPPVDSRDMRLWERNKTLVKEVRFADQTCVELAGQKAALEKEITLLREQLNDARQQSRIFQHELLDAQRMAMQSESHCNRIQTDCEARIQELQRLHDQQLTEARSDWQSAEGKLLRMEFQKDLQAAEEQWDKGVTHWEEKYEELKLQLQAERSAKTTFEIQLQSAREKADIFSNELSCQQQEWIDERDNLNRELNLRQHECEDIRLARDHIQEESNQLRQELELKQQKILDLQAELAELKHGYDLNKMRCNDLEQRVSELETECSAIKGERENDRKSFLSENQRLLSDTGTLVSKLESELIAVRKGRDAMADELAQCRSKHHESLNEVHSLQSEIRLLEKQCKDLITAHQSSIERLHAEKDEIQSEVTALKDANDCLQDTLRDKSAALEQATLLCSQIKEESVANEQLLERSIESVRSNLNLRSDRLEFDLLEKTQEFTGRIRQLSDTLRIFEKVIILQGGNADCRLRPQQTLMYGFNNSTTPKESSLDATFSRSLVDRSEVLESMEEARASTPPRANLTHVQNSTGSIPNVFTGTSCLSCIPGEVHPTVNLTGFSHFLFDDENDSVLQGLVDSVVFPIGDETLGSEKKIEETSHVITYSKEELAKLQNAFSMCGAELAETKRRLASSFEERDRILDQLQRIQELNTNLDEELKDKIKELTTEIKNNTKLTRAIDELTRQRNQLQALVQDFKTQTVCMTENHSLEIGTIFSHGDIHTMNESQLNTGDFRNQECRNTISTMDPESSEFVNTKCQGSLNQVVTDSRQMPNLSFATKQSPEVATNNPDYERHKSIQGTIIDQDRYGELDMHQDNAALHEFELKYNAMQAAYRECSSKLESKETANAGLNQDLSLHKATLEQLQHELNILTTAKQSWNEALERLKSELRESEQKRELIQSQLDDITIEKEKMENELTITSKYLIEKDRLVNDLTCRLEKQNKALDEATAQLNNAQTDLGERETVLASLKSAYAACNDSLARVVEERDKLNAELEDQKSLLQAAEELEYNAESRFLEIQCKLEEVLVYHHSVLEEKAELQKRVEETEKELIRIKQAFGDELKLKESRIETALNEKQDLSSRFAAQVAENHSLLVAISEKNNVNAMLSRELEESTKHVLQLQSNINTFQAKERELDEMREKHKVVDLKCQRLRTWVRKLADKCDQWEMFHDRQAKFLSKLRSASERTRENAAKLVEWYDRRDQQHSEERAMWSTERFSLQFFHSQLEKELDMIAKELSDMVPAQLVEIK